MNNMDNKIAEENVFYTGLGNVLCMEGITGRYFRTNAGHIKSIKREINDVLYDNVKASISDYFNILRLPDVPIASIGWNKNDKELLTEELDIDFKPVVAESGEWCLVITPSLMPTWL